LQNAEVVVWTFTTMNSYWVAHAGSENHCETTKSLKIVYLFNINQERVYYTKISGRRRTETTHQQQVNRSETRV